MKSIKNSINKLTTTLSLREPIQSNQKIVDIEIKRQKYQQSITSIVSYKGYEFPGDAVHKRVLENIEDFDVREDDIFIISYPANGGHLLDDIVQALVQKDLENKKKASMSVNKQHKETNDGNDEKISIPIARLEAFNLYGHIRWLKSIKSPRLISTNLPYDLLPQQLHTPTAKLIYMSRNSKDHIVAYYYHHRLKGIQITLDNFIDLYLNGYLLYGNYFDHIVSYWQLSQLYENNVLFICYEELKIITLTIAKLIVQFLNLNLNEKEIEEIIMNKQGRKNTISGDDLRQVQDPNREHTQKLNKFHNVLGDWNHYLNSEQVRLVDEMIRIKFESQQLYLAEDAKVALQNIQKYGRILKTDLEKNHKRKSKILNNFMDGKNAMLALALPGKQQSMFKKKLVLTKDEARFIRKKDKVVIIDDHIDGEPKENVWLIRKLALFCCCCCSSYFKKDSYEKL